MQLTSFPHLLWKQSLVTTLWLMGYWWNETHSFESGSEEGLCFWFFFLSSPLSGCDTKDDPRSYVLEMTESLPNWIHDDFLHEQNRNFYYVNPLSSAVYILQNLILAKVRAPPNQPHWFSSKRPFKSHYIFFIVCWFFLLTCKSFVYNKCIFTQSFQTL